MKIKKYITIALAAVLCLAMLLPLVPFESGAEPVNFHENNISIDRNGVYQAKFNQKTLSILGDSISTFEGVSNDGTVNSTIANNAVYYYKNTVSEYGVDRKDTWWQQAIDTLGMGLCVNNSWSGSQVMGTASGDAYRAWQNRCKQLHKTVTMSSSTTATINPDAIAVYLGTNDVKNADSTFATFSANKELMLKEAAYTDANIVAASVKPFSRYIKMVNNMLNTYKASGSYEGAQIYLFTLLPNESQNDVQKKYMEDFNQSIRDLVTYYQGQSKKVYLVDLYNETSITNDLEVLKKHLANCLHPNALGMDVITNCFLSALVQKSGWALNPGNYKTVEYDLTDVYVQGGQVNVKRVSGTDKAPLSVSLVPTRAEYGMEVMVEKHHKNDNIWYDITKECYSDGTVYIGQMGHSYDKFRITAKATYKPKNFRWETVGSSFVSKVPDGSNYGVSGTLTQNDATLTNGSYDGTTFTNGQYKLSDTVLLRNEEPWVIEWKAKGTLAKSLFLFSGDKGAASRSNNYIYFNVDKILYIGYRNDYRNQYWNFGINIPTDKFTFDNNTSHVYRLANQLNADGTNMVYLYIDDTKIGAMDTYVIGGTDQTGTLDKQNWLSGRDFEFPYIGAENFYLNYCGIEYLQVWEGGGFDTLRLQQLVDEYHNELSTSMAGATNFNAYKTAVQNAESYLSNTTNLDRTQAKYDEYVTAIVTARNNLTKAAANGTKIYSAELINGGYVPLGMTAGIKVITTPDVQKVQVGDSGQTLLTNTSSIQTMKIDGTDTEVKVWLLSWRRSKNLEEKVVSYRIHAATDSGATIDGKNDTDSKASVSIDVPYVSNWITHLEVDTTNGKTVYRDGDKFDPTGLVVTAHYADGSQEVITNYTYPTNTLNAEYRYMTISYVNAAYTQNSVSVNVPIKVYCSVSGLTNMLLDSEVNVIGYYVGAANEGLSSDKELLLKDTKTDDIIAVRGFPLTFPYNDLNVGDELRVKGVYKLDGSTNTPNKRYIDCTSGTGQRVSEKNPVSYELKNTVKVSSWDEMQALFQAGTIKDYTYIEFTGDLYLNKYDGEDGSNYRLHMNAGATTNSGIKSDGRAICLRQDVMERNLGTNWLTNFALDSVATTYPGTKVNGKLIALYTGANSTYFQLTVLDSTWIMNNVSALSNLSAGTNTTVVGYYVGIADEGLNSDKELLLKDKYTDDIIAVRNFPGTFPDYDVKYNHELKITGTYKKDGTANTPNKMYMDYKSHDILSAGNTVNYQFNNIVKVSSWAEMQALFKAGTIKEYTYIEFSGDLYLHKYQGKDGFNYWLHMNTGATSRSDMESDGRYICLRQNVMEKNLGTNWLSRLGLYNVATDYPGTKLNGKLIALYTGANNSYFQLTVLSNSWIG